MGIIFKWQISHHIKLMRAGLPSRPLGKGVSKWEGYSSIWICFLWLIRSLVPGPLCLHSLSWECTAVHRGKIWKPSSRTMSGASTVSRHKQVNVTALFLIWNRYHDQRRIPEIVVRVDENKTTGEVELGNVGMVVWFCNQGWDIRCIFGSLSLSVSLPMVTRWTTTDSCMELVGEEYAVASSRCAPAKSSAVGSQSLLCVSFVQRIESR